MRIFDAKVRQVGGSLGVLIPKESILESNIKKDQTVKVAIIKKNPAAIKKAFGMLRGTRPFVRDHEDRPFS